MRIIGVHLAIAFLAVAAGAVMADELPNIFESSTSVSPTSEIDKIVFARLKSLDIKPVLCSDSVFVRRAYLDVIGTLPTPMEVIAFLDDENEKKREALIDQLMKRPEFADYWSMKWGDVLRIKAEFPVNLWPNAAQAYHHWVRSSIVENKPYDRFARELLTSSGSNFRVGPVNFYRAIQNKTPEGITGAVALSLMGARADSWPKQRREGMAVFFSQVGYKPTSEWKEEHVFWDPYNLSSIKGSTAPGQAAIGRQPKKKDEKGADKDVKDEQSEEPPTIPEIAKSPEAVLPDGTKVELPENQDPREVFADWLITPENPWFAKSIVNRTWAWLLGRGIIHEPDDIREGNPPSNPELLAYLERELVENDYDLKHLYRLILTSKTYQMSSIPVDNPAAAANFARYPLRRLDAEVLIDAVNKVTGTTDLYTSPIPEPFTYIPKSLPAIALADGSITSSFLALFGRSARATGMFNERNNEPVSGQSLHMLNSSHIQFKLERGPKIKKLIASKRKLNGIVRQLYVTILSRRPTEEELKTIAEYAETTRSKRREVVVDTAWALINSTEFLYRH